MKLLIKRTIHNTEVNLVRQRVIRVLGDFPGIHAPIYIERHPQIIWTIEGRHLTTFDLGVKPLKISLPYVGIGATIEEIYLQLGTAPAVSNVRINILKNGVSIFDAVHYVEIPVGATVVSQIDDLVGGGACEKDDCFQIEVVQGDAVAADLVVHLRYDWRLTH